MQKILVIEDEDAIREDIVEILNHVEFEAIAAENGLIGVQLAKSFKPDLIICDIMMPELDGYGVLAQLRQDPATALTPFIFLTAKVDNADRRYGMNLGADDYLTKPIGQAELLEAINSRLNKKAQFENHYNALIQSTQSQLDYLIHYDSLTNLPNRFTFRVQLQEILQAIQTDFQFVLVLLIDIDRFNRINDTLGQTFADNLLKSVAERLGKCVEQEDILARLDADEFAIILTAVDPKGEADKVAQTILKAIAQPFNLEEQEIYLTCSVGIAVYPQDGSDIDSLIKHIKVATNHAKRQGGNCYRFYASEIQVEFSEKLILEAGLHHALERNEFQVYYQPQVSLRTGKIVATEALIRWYHNELGVLSPQKFLPLAEESGSIVAIDEWVLCTACRQAKEWQSVLSEQLQSTSVSNIRVAVNLSGRQFHQPNLSATVLRVLEEVDFDPQYLELELTEGIIINDLDASIAKLNELKSLGIQLALDDFGTGQSSLSYLKRFPIDTLKIDKSFVANMMQDTTSRAITLAIIRLAHSLNLKVIAEGVELEEEIDFLKEHGCDEIQGYIFSRPLPAEELKRLLITNQCLPV